MHFILSDNIDSGKSSFCQELITRLVRDSVPVSGWITPAFMEEEKKAGHDFIAIEDGHLEKKLPLTRTYPFPESFPWKNWHFNPVAFERATKLQAERGLFIMDEIGPLEFEDRKGFFEPFKRAFAQTPYTLTVVRSGLEGALIDLFPQEAFSHFTLATCDRMENTIHQRLAPRR